MPAPASTAAIADALFRHLREMTNAPPIAFPNRDFTPPTDEAGNMQPYFAAAFMPNRPVSQMIRFEDPNEQRGLLQVSVYWPLNAGTLPAQRLADLIMARFARGTVIAADGFAVRVIEDPWSSSPLNDTTRAMIPVTVPWSVH